MRYFVIVAEKYSEYMKGPFIINNSNKIKIGSFVAKIAVIKSGLMQLKTFLDSYLRLLNNE